MDAQVTSTLPQFCIIADPGNFDIEILTTWLARYKAQQDCSSPVCGAISYAAGSATGRRPAIGFVTPSGCRYRRSPKSYSGNMAAETFTS